MAGKGRKQRGAGHAEGRDEGGNGWCTAGAVSPGRGSTAGPPVAAETLATTQSPPPRHLYASFLGDGRPTTRGEEGVEGKKETMGKVDKQWKVDKYGQKIPAKKSTGTAMKIEVQKSCCFPYRT